MSITVAFVLAIFLACVIELEAAKIQRAVKDVAHGLDDLTTRVTSIEAQIDRIERDAADVRETVVGSRAS